MQKRIGKNGKIFQMIKFRSMSVIQRSNSTISVKGDMRITPIGIFLRKYKLDELPELWNVLKGDMSLVGPRPLLIEYVLLYSSEQARRHVLRPGVSGWAQVNGRNAISWEEKFKLDVWYVDNRSLWLDFKVICVTLKKVILCVGISADGEATMSKFKGSSQ